MSRTWYRRWADHKVRASSQARRHKARVDSDRYRPFAEPLEDRTLLTGGADLNSFFAALQNSLNAHLLLPSVSYSLPLVGKDLGVMNSPGQFLSAIGGVIQGVADATDTNMLQSKIATVVDADMNHTGTVLVTRPHGSQTDYAISITNAQIKNLSEVFDVGLPGLEHNTSFSNPLTQLVHNLVQSTPLNVTVNLTYNLQLFYTVDASNNVTLDTRTTIQTAPLLTMTIAATLNQSLPSQNLGLFTVDVNGTANFSPMVQLTVDPNTYPPNPNLIGNSHVSLSSAVATITLAMPLSANMAPLPGLENDLTITWNLGGTNPLDNANNVARPMMAFDVYLNLSGVVGWMNSILGPVSQKLAPLKPIINTIENTLHAKIPIVGDLIPSLGTLDGILSAKAPDKYPQIQSFLGALDTIINVREDLSSLTGSGTIQVAHVPLTIPQGPLGPMDNDPRFSNFDLTAVLPSTVSPSQAANTFLSLIHLPGSFSIPLIANPVDDLKALLLGQNVVLVQWTLPSLNIPNLAGISIGPFYIFPPLALELGLTFGLQGGLTLGYDTFGFTDQWAMDQARTGNQTANRISDGVFIQDAHLTLSGSISLTAEADVVIAQLGGGGTITLTFGIQSLNDVQGQNGAVLDAGSKLGNLNPTDHPFHVTTFAGQSENVLQLGDFLWDVIHGSPLCPFTIGGQISASLSVFLTLGVDPFSITFTYDFGSITLASFPVDCCTSSGTPPPIAEPAYYPNVDADLTAVDQTYFGKHFAGTGTFLQLDLGQHVRSSDYANQDEADFEISPGLNNGDLVVQGFGQAQVFPGLNTIDPRTHQRTTIVAYGDTSQSSKPIRITVDPGVHANAYLVGGANFNSFNYQGDGDVYMKGGPATTLFLGHTPDGTPSNPKPQNVLVGGSGDNYLEGGDVAGGTPPPYANQAWWNSLKAGGGLNALQGGRAGASLYGGPNSDRLTGGNGAVSYLLSAGKGNDTLLGGGANAFNEFQWIEGDGSVDVTGGTNGQSNANVFNIAAATPDETWHVSQDSNTQIPSDILVTTLPSTNRVIRARRLQVLSIDDSPRIVNPNRPPDFIYPPGQAVHYVVDDLSRTELNLLNLNLHEQANPDVYQDTVLVNAPPQRDAIDLTWSPRLAGFQGLQPVFGATTDLTITPPPICGITCFPVSYQINTAIPKPSDSLRVDASGDTQNDPDTVTIHGTQPNVAAPDPAMGCNLTDCSVAYKAGGHVYVKTGGGNDLITVGDVTYGLDNFFGPLDIDAGAGHNQIIFTEGASAVHDIVTLTASQLIRYTKSPVVIVGETTYVGYPFIINYTATGGDFAGDVYFYTSTYVSGAFTDLYLPETGLNAPLRVIDGNSRDDTHVGFDGAFPANQSQITIQDITFAPPFPTTVASSTLSLIRSSVFVQGHSGSSRPTLAVEDEAAPAGQAYTLGIATTLTIPPDPIGDYVARNGGRDIEFNNLDMTFDTGTSSMNSVAAQGVFPGTSVTINARGQSNTLTVGDSMNKLDEISGPLMLNGLGSNNVVVIHDEGSHLPQPNYILTTTTLQRIMAPPVTALITYTNMQSFTLTAGSGGNSVTILGTAAPTTYHILAGSGTDRIQLGSPTSSLGLFLGNLMIDGQGGTNPLLIYDGPPSGGQTYVITATSLKRGASTLATYANVSSLTFNSSGGNTIDLESTALTTPVTIYGGSGPDTINIGMPGAGDPVGTIAAAVTVNAGTGAATVNVGSGGANSTMDNIQGAVTVNGRPSFSSQLGIYDQGHTFSPSRIYTVSVTQVTRTGPPVAVAPINYANLTALVVYGSGSYAVTATTTSTTLNTGPGDATITVGDSNNTLSSVHGALTVNGGNGNNTLALHDENNVIDPYTLTATTLMRPGTALISYQGIKQLALGAGFGPIHVNLQGTAAGTSYLVTSDFASAVITLGNTANSLDALQGALTVDIQGGSNTLIINDQGTPTPNLTYTLAAGTFQRTGTGLMNFLNIASITLNTGSGVDTVNVQSSSAPLTINTFGGGGQDLIALGNAGSVQSIQAAVTIGPNSQSATQVRVDDSADPTGQTVTLAMAGTNGTINGLLPNSALITYTLAHVAAVTVTGGTGGNTFLITGTGGGFPTTVNPGTAGDQVFVQGSSATALLQITTGTGDTVTLSNTSDALDGIGPVTVNDPTDTSTVIADDSGYGALENYTLTASTFWISRSPYFLLTCGGVANLILTGSNNGENGFELTGTPAGSAVSINPGQQGGNQINIESSAATGSVTIDTAPFDVVYLSTLQNTLDGIGNVYVEDFFGTSIVSVDDSGYGASDDYFINNATVSTARLPNLLTYTGIQSLWVYGGAGMETFDIDSTLPYVQTRIQGGSGGNCYHISPFTQYLASIAGPLTINGGGNDTLEFFDTNNPNIETYTFDNIPSMLTLATVPSFAANWTGVGTVVLETNGMSTVIDPSNSVIVDPDGGPPCLPGPQYGAGARAGADPIVTAGMGAATSRSPWRPVGIALPSLADRALAGKEGTLFDAPFLDDLALAEIGGSVHRQGVRADLSTWQKAL